MNTTAATTTTAEQFERAARRFIANADPANYLPAHTEWNVSTANVRMVAAVDDDGNLWVGCPDPDSDGEWLYEVTGAPAPRRLIECGTDEVIAEQATAEQIEASDATIEGLIEVAGQDGYGWTRGDVVAEGQSCPVPTVTAWVEA